jgi:hypothetical protein
VCFFQLRNILTASTQDTAKDGNYMTQFGSVLLTALTESTSVNLIKLSETPIKTASVKAEIEKRLRTSKGGR